METYRMPASAKPGLRLRRLGRASQPPESCVSAGWVVRLAEVRRRPPYAFTLWSTLNICFFSAG